MHITADQLEALPQRQRVTLVNCLSGFKSANLVGSQDARGRTNLAIISSAFHLGADPALIGFISRPDSVDRHTLENIRESGEYTINHVHEGMIAAAHQTSARYPKEISEFDAVGLSVAYRGALAAPYVGESRVSLGLRLSQLVDIPANGTVMVIGQIDEIFVPDAAVGADGFVDLAALGSVMVTGLDSYHCAGKGQRYAYAKPDRAPSTLD